MGLAERADLIVDFTHVPVGNYVLGNVGPDEPFGGGTPGVDFPVADPASTGQVLEFRVVPAVAPDPTTPPQFLVLPPITPLPTETLHRPLALIERMGIGHDASGEPVEGPVEALLGEVIDGVLVERLWMDPVSENPEVGDDGGVGVRERDRRRAPHARARGRVRGGEPRGPRAER